LSDLYDKSNDEMEDFNSFDPEEHNEHRFEEEVRFEKGSQERLLAYRKEEIERVIDDHLIFLHGEH